MEGGAEMTAAILKTRPAAPPGIDTAVDPTRLARLFRLDLLRVGPRRELVCRWHRDAAGHLAAAWEPDISLAPLL
jgi:hypothetical protein